MTSDNYVAGTTGFKFDRNSAEINTDVTIEAANISGKLTSAEIEADKITGDIVSAIAKTAVSVSLNNTGTKTFGSVDVKNSRPYDRTLSVTLLLTVNANAVKQSDSTYYTSHCEAEVRSSGSFGSVNSRRIRVDKSSGTLDQEFSTTTSITFNIPVAANKSGSQAFI